jgi:hypothetical protein
MRSPPLPQDIPNASSDITSRTSHATSGLGTWSAVMGFRRSNRRRVNVEWSLGRIWLGQVSHGIIRRIRSTLLAGGRAVPGRSTSNRFTVASSIPASHAKCCRDQPRLPRSRLIACQRVLGAGSGLYPRNRTIAGKKRTSIGVSPRSGRAHDRRSRRERWRGRRTCGRSAAL